MSSDKLRIDTGRLDDISQQFSRLGGSLTTISGSINEAINTARSVVPEQESIIRNLTKLNSRVTSAGNYARKLSGAVRNASAKWAEVEAKVGGTRLGSGEDAGVGKGGDANGSGSGGGKAGEENPAWKKILDLLFKAVGGTGAFGKMVSAIWSGFSKGDLKGWLKAGTDFFIGGIGKVIMEGAKGTNADWAKALFGLGEYTKTFTENVTNPLSIATNVIKSVIDNWDLAEGGNIPRFIMETGAEAGTNLLLGAGGLALAAAILPAGAPVIAVGAAGAALVWGANELVKWGSKTLFGTEKDIAGWVGEGVGWLTDRAVEGAGWLADKAVEGGKWLVQKGGEAVDWVVDKGGQAINWVAEKGSQAIDWVADKGQQLLDTGARAISDAADAVSGFFGWVFG